MTGPDLNMVRAARGEQHFEYQVISARGVGYPAPTIDRGRCYARLAQLDDTKPMRAPHSVRRRLVGAWEPEECCESCGRPALVTLDDGSHWCESCDEAARRLEATDAS